MHAYDETALKEAQPLNGAAQESDFDEWKRTNVYAQRQKGYSVATIALPLGDLTSMQMRRLVTICKRYVKDTVRTTVEQNIVLRWVSDADLPALFTDLKSAGLAHTGAGTLVDITRAPAQTLASSESLLRAV